MHLSRHVMRIRPSGTIRLAEMARQRADSGKRTHDLAEGESSFDTPDHIIEAAHRAACEGQTRYTSVAGTAVLREAVAEKFRSENRLACGTDCVIIGTGAKQLIYTALCAGLDVGDRVIVPAPYWTSYPDIVKLAGGEPVIVCCARTGSRLTPEALDAAIGPRTRFLILNSPGNPGGMVYGAGELLALAEVLRRHPHIGILSDDIYEKILFRDEPFVTLAQVAPDLAERTVTVNGVSKSYAMTGWRVGYATGPGKFIAAMSKLQGQLTTCTSSIAQAAALAALIGPQNFLDDWLAAYIRRRDMLLAAIAKIPGLEARVPEGAFYVFAACNGLLGRQVPKGGMIRTDIELSEYLLEASGVAVVPGTEFGAPGHLRLCFAKPDEVMAEASRDMADAITVLG